MLIVVRPKHDIIVPKKPLAHQGIIGQLVRGDKGISIAHVQLIDRIGTFRPLDHDDNAAAIAQRRGIKNLFLLAAFRPRHILVPSDVFFAIRKVLADLLIDNPISVHPVPCAPANHHRIGFLCAWGLLCCPISFFPTLDRGRTRSGLRRRIWRSVVGGHFPSCRFHQVDIAAALVAHMAFPCAALDVHRTGRMFIFMIGQRASDFLPSRRLRLIAQLAHKLAHQLRIVMWHVFLLSISPIWLAI